MKAIPGYWKIAASGEPSAIRMNFIGGLISVLNRMIYVSFGGEQINYKNRVISENMSITCVHLQKMTEEQIALHFLWEKMEHAYRGGKMP